MTFWRIIDPYLLEDFVLGKYLYKTALGPLCSGKNQNEHANRPMISNASLMNLYTTTLDLGITTFGMPSSFGIRAARSSAVTRLPKQ